MKQKYKNRNTDASSAMHLCSFHVKAHTNVSIQHGAHVDVFSQWKYRSITKNDVIRMYMRSDPMTQYLQNIMCSVINTGLCMVCTLHCMRLISKLITWCTRTEKKNKNGFTFVHSHYNCINSCAQWTLNIRFHFIDWLFSSWYLEKISWTLLTSNAILKIENENIPGLYDRCESSSFAIPNIYDKRAGNMEQTHSTNKWKTLISNRNHHIQSKCLLLCQLKNFKRANSYRTHSHSLISFWKWRR